MLDGLCEFVEHYRGTRWVGPDGFPSSWRFYVYAQRHRARERARASLQMAGAAMIANAAKQEDRDAWFRRQLQQAGW